MLIPQEWEYTHDEKLSEEEYEVIRKFLAAYKNQNVIVADNYREDCNIVPFRREKSIFRPKDYSAKFLDFQRRIFHKGKFYVVELGLSNTQNGIDPPGILSISKFRIITKGRVHFIDLTTENALKENILFNIISTFDEDKIVSPVTAYQKRMIVNKPLQEFIGNHEWGKIQVGLDQNPKLSNALFLMREETANSSRFHADFGTILYQLISFRRQNADKLKEDDLRELDKVILNLSRTELLKVELTDTTSVVGEYSKKSILVDRDYRGSNMQIAAQKTVGNAELLDEQKVLNKGLKDSRKRS